MLAALGYSADGWALVKELASGDPGPVALAALDAVAKSGIDSELVTGGLVALAALADLAPDDLAAFGKAIGRLADREDHVSENQDETIRGIARDFAKWHAELPPEQRLDLLVREEIAKAKVPTSVAWSTVLASEEGRRLYAECTAAPAGPEPVAKSAAQTSAEAQLDRLAKSKAAADGMSFFAAYADVLDTPEGRALYRASQER